MVGKEIEFCILNIFAPKRAVFSAIFDLSVIFVYARLLCWEAMMTGLVCSPQCVASHAFADLHIHFALILHANTRTNRGSCVHVLYSHNLSFGV